jgi:hypothetical protein
MNDESEKPRVTPVRKMGQITVCGGAPIEYGEAVEVEHSEPVSAKASAVLETFRAYHAFLWTPDDGMIDLGTLGGSGSQVTNSSARVLKLFLHDERSFLSAGDLT